MSREELQFVWFTALMAVLGTLLMLPFGLALSWA